MHILHVYRLYLESGRLTTCKIGTFKPGSVFLVWLFINSWFAVNMFDLQVTCFQHKKYVRSLSNDCTHKVLQMIKLAIHNSYSFGTHAKFYLPIYYCSSSSLVSRVLCSITPWLLCTPRMQRIDWPHSNVQVQLTHTFSSTLLFQSLWTWSRSVWTWYWSVLTGPVSDTHHQQG